jgi:POT family proton-dependent oligopeptide transporter
MEDASSPASASTTTLRRAKTIIFYMEMCELFGRFGLNVLMVLYLKQIFQFSDEKAFNLFASFSALLFLTPLVCGIIVDKYLTVRSSIIAGSILNIAGSLLICVPEIQYIFIGFSFLAVGNGFFLPGMLKVISSFFYKAEDKDTGFTLYWVIKNVGAILSGFTLSDIAKNYGFSIAFFINAAIMIIGIILFISSKSISTECKKIEFNQNNYKQIFISSVFLFAVSYLLIYNDISEIILTVASLFVLFIFFKIFKKEKKFDLQKTLKILSAFILTVIFLGCLSQGGMSLTLFIERIIDRNILGYEVSPAFFYGLEPSFMLIIGPLLALLYKFTTRRNKEISSGTKVSMGLFTLAAGFGILLIGSQQATEHAGLVSSFYVAGAYALFATAELLVIPICISLFDKNGPQNAKGFIFSVFALSQAFSAYVAGTLSNRGKIEFEIKSMEQFVKASQIYSNLFVLTITILVISGVIAFLASIFAAKMTVK